MADQERELAIHPIVAESVQHNTQVPLPSHPIPSSLPLILLQTLSTLRSLTSSLFGVAAGTLGLESYLGFLFYLLGTLFVSALVHALLCGRDGRRYFQSPVAELWAGDVVGGLSSFVMTWTLFYGLVRA